MKYAKKQEDMGLVDAKENIQTAVKMADFCTMKGGAPEPKWVPQVNQLSEQNTLLYHVCFFLGFFLKKKEKVFKIALLQTK